MRLGGSVLSTWNAAGRPVGKLGRFGYNYDLDRIEMYDGTKWQTIDIYKSRDIIIELPSSSEDITFFYTAKDITITQMSAIVAGTNPSVTWTIRHDPDRTVVGNEVVTGGKTTTSTTTADVITTFDLPNIPLGSFIWLETTASAGTVTAMHVSVRYE
jgi:hypothetical protein